MHLSAKKSRFCDPLLNLLDSLNLLDWLAKLKAALIFTDLLWDITKGRIQKSNQMKSMHKWRVLGSDMEPPWLLQV